MSQQVKHQVQAGQPIHVESREQSQRNGTIKSVLFDDEEIVVAFENTEHLETMTFDELEGNWTESFGGMWYIHAG